MKKLLVAVLAAAFAYVAFYFAVMEKGTAVNPDTLLPEYRSISRFADGVRIDGIVQFKVARSHWRNPVFAPLDRVFR